MNNYENPPSLPYLIKTGIVLAFIFGLATPASASAEIPNSQDSLNGNSLQIPPRETLPEGVTPLRCDVSLPPWMVDPALPPWMQEVPPDWPKVNCTLNTETDHNATIPAINVSFPFPDNNIKAPTIVEAFFKESDTTGVVVIDTLKMDTTADNVCYYQTQQTVLSYEQTVQCTRAIISEALVTANINGKVIRFARGGGQFVWRYTMINDIPYLDFGTGPLVKLTDFEGQIREFENSKKDIEARRIFVTPQFPSMTEHFPPVPILPTAQVKGGAKPDPLNLQLTPSAEISPDELAPALQNAFGLEILPPSPIGLLSLNLAGELPRVQVFSENPEDIHLYGDATIAQDPDFELLSQLLVDTPFNVQSVFVRVGRLTDDHQTLWEDFWKDQLNKFGIFPDRSDTIRHKEAIPAQMSLELMRRVGSRIEITGQVNGHFTHFSLPISSLRKIVRNSPDGLAAIQPNGGTNPEIAQMIEALILSKKPFPAAHTVHPDFVTSIVRSNRPDLVQNTVHTHPFATDGYVMNRDLSRSTYLPHIPANLPLIITGIVRFNGRYYYTATSHEPTSREDILDFSEIAYKLNYTKHIGDIINLLLPIEAVVADDF